jgi:hypothetical protein
VLRLLAHKSTSTRHHLPPRPQKSTSPRPQQQTGNKAKALQQQQQQVPTLNFIICRSFMLRILKRRRASLLLRL